MSPRRHYGNAPITEAVIDLRAQLPAAVTLADLERIHAGEEGVYQQKETRSLAKGKFQIGKEVSASASSEPIGFLYRTSNGKQIYQARRDGFTFSRLAPYENWESFRDEARRLWVRYRDALQPESILRLALRYINRLDLPLPLDDFKAYLLTIPEVAPRLPQGLAGFFLQLNIPQPDLRCTLLINETVIDPQNPNTVSVVLDIDLFRDEDVPQDDVAVWEFFEELHDRKNEIFEACITDRTRELIA